MELSRLIVLGCLVSLALSIIAVLRSYRKSEAPFVDKTLERLKGHKIRRVRLVMDDVIQDHTLIGYDRDALFMQGKLRTVAVMRHAVVWFSYILADEAAEPRAAIEMQSLTEFLRNLKGNKVEYSTVLGDRRDDLRLERVDGRAIWLYHDDDWSKKEQPLIITFEGLCTIGKTPAPGSA